MLKLYSDENNKAFYFTPYDIQEVIEKSESEIRNLCHITFRDSFFKGTLVVYNLTIDMLDAYIKVAISDDRQKVFEEKIITIEADFETLE